MKTPFAALALLLVQCTPILAVPPPTSPLEIDAAGNVQQSNARIITPTGVQSISNKTVDASNIISPSVTMFPRRLVVEGDSLSNAGTLYWPANFTGVSTGLTGSPISYDSVISYAGGDATGVKPLTSWPEQFEALAGSSTQLIDFAYAGRTTTDIDQFYWQEAHLTAPRFTGVPSAFSLWTVNQLSQSDSAAAIWAEIQTVLNAARAGGYSPIILFTAQPSPDSDATYAVGGTWDVKRLALNALITGSSGVADIIIDLNAVPGLQATNTPTSGQHYNLNTTNYTSSGTNFHPTAAGNAIVASKVFSSIGAWGFATPSKTQSVQQDYAEFSYHVLSPWARRSLLVADLQAGNSGGDVYTGEGPGGSIGIRNGAASTNYSRGFWFPEFLGIGTGYNGSSGSVRQRTFVDWGHPQIVEFSFQPDWGNTGHNWANTVWQVIYGRANGYTPGALVNGDQAVGILIDGSVVGQITIKAIAANGTAATTSAALAVIADNGTVYGSHNVQMRTDGYGNLFVKLDGVTTTLSGIAPTAVFSSNNQLSLEAYTTGTESNNGYIYFSAPALSTW